MYGDIKIRLQGWYVKLTISFELDQKENSTYHQETSKVKMVYAASPPFHFKLMLALQLFLWGLLSEGILHQPQSRQDENSGNYVEQSCPHFRYNVSQYVS
jgi:hypothetical protein